MTKRRLAVLAALPVLAMSTACGAQSFASASSPSVSATAGWHETAVKFAGCMRENGIDIPDPVKGQDIDTSAVTKVTQAKLDAAMKACKEWDSVLLGGSEPSSPEDDAKFAAWAKCLREGGVWQPIDKDEKKPAGFKEVKPKSAAWQRVHDGCASLQPPAPYEN
ncbi:hypothetical protein [Rhizohabitans arisaemae]|uniref:hypothetical protein n=1 Tax=Rhizohabitans arisaemae TaxID=2720610 RepID=UPI0024B2546B|nr:hypothetical protein [Rhizohabitans arisaemae]